MPHGATRFCQASVAAMVGLAVLAACAPASSTRTQPGGAPQLGSQASSGPKGTLRIAWAGEPPTLSPKMTSPGGSAFNELAVTFNSALTYYDPASKPIPQIAREIPTVDNGGWVLNPDGTMVTTYKLREHAKWHDGAPLTAHDFAFAFSVYANPDVPVYRRETERLMAGVEAADDHTVVINWKAPYYRANALRYTQLDPLPAHILADTYRQDVAEFLAGSYWTIAYVGSGPFRVERWDPGISITARAFTDWVLGPPKAATLEIRFIADANTILANLLSGDLDISAHPFFPPSLAAQVRDRWEGGGMGYIAITESRMQHMDLRQNEMPGWQSALTDVRVRQAVLTAIDREGLFELLNFGLGGSVADAFILRADPIFPDVDRALFKYPYDPARAVQLFADAGWRRAQPEAPLTNAAGQTFEMQIRSTAGPAGEHETSFILSSWKGVGIDGSAYLIPRALAGDPELDATFPGGRTSNRPIVPENFAWTTAQIASLQGRWLGQNRGGFSDPIVDRWQAAVLTATTPRAWTEANLALHRRMSEVLGTLPLFYPADVIVARHPIKGPAGHFTYPCYSWNIFEWGFAE